MYSPFYRPKHVTNAQPATETGPSEARAVKTLGWWLHKAAAGTFEDFHKVNKTLATKLSNGFFLLFLFLFFMNKATPEDPDAVSALIGSQYTSNSRSPSHASSLPPPPLLFHAMMDGPRRHLNAAKTVAEKKGTSLGPLVR